MSALPSAELSHPGADRTGRVAAHRLALGARQAAWVVPAGLALAYIVLVVIRFPQIIAWQNADSDVASSYQLAQAILHGHTGVVQFSTQGSWIELGWQLLTAGLPDHRLWWELLAPGLGALTVLVIAWTVRRVAGTAAAVLAAALVAATSPDGLMNLVSAPWHNTSTLGAALLGAYLVWLRDGGHRPAVMVLSVVAMSIVCGVFLASDHLLAIIGLVPFLVASVAADTGAGRIRALLLSVTVCVGSAITGGAVSAITGALGLRTTTPGLWPASGHMMEVHLTWLADGLLRLGNGLSVEPHSAALTPLVGAAAAVTVAGLAAMLWATGRALARRAADPGRAVHASFWCAAAICATVAFVVTNAAYEPSDRYFFVVVPAVAATVPLLLERGRRRVAVPAAAAVYIAAGLAAFASGAMHTPGVIITSRATVDTGRIERIVARDHLTVGYAGYWNAAALEWSSGERLHLAPLLGTPRSAAPMFSMRVTSWYRPRAGVASYLVLAPGDPTLPDRLPASLPAPARSIRVGQATIDIWPHDIAADLGRSRIPLAGS